MEKKEIKFEDNLNKLETIVKNLESGDIDLDDAIKEFNEAMKIAKACDEKLKKAEAALTKLVGDNGELKDLEVE